VRLATASLPPHPVRRTAVTCHHLWGTGIQLLQADDLKTWFFSIEVLGESLYKVPFYRYTL